MDKTSILDLFYECVRKYEDKIAVICGNKKITYKELNEMSNSMADDLKSLGLKKGDFGILYAEKSVEMIGVIFASLKLEMTYVPLDIRYPEDRINYIIEDCKPKVIYTYNTSLKYDGCISFDMNGYQKKSAGEKYKGNYNNIDYCIYTSGTTGKPKGVLIRDQSVVNLARSYYDIYDINSEDILLQFASIAFDQSVWDIFSILTCGGTLCIIPQELVTDIRGSEEYILKNKVTVAAFTPAYLRELNPEKLTTLLKVESGGAAVEKEVVKKWKKYCRVFNTYGPTEACVNALSYELTDEIPEYIPIGKPVHNMEAYILDSDNHQCRDGEVGELCLAGVQLAVGYLNNPELTEKKFINNPFGKGRIYKTGDLAKKLKDGNIICVGRCDNQLKIRGFRIETDEIEEVMRKYGNSAVGVEKNQLGENILIGYIVSKLTKEELLKNLQKFLPDYMIPSKIIYLDSLPLNVNGKIDYKKLHSIYLESLENMSIEKPKTDFQKIACKVIGSILNIDNYGVNFNFVESGGNSINSIRISALLNEEGYNISVSDLLTTNDIKDLENRIKSKKKMKEIKEIDLHKNIKLKEELSKAIGNEIKNFSKLTPTQLYMYRAYKENIVGDNFLQYLYKINCEYNFDILRETVNLLPIQYDSLTSNFIEFNNNIYQVTFDNKEIEVKEVSVGSQAEIDEYMKNDIQKGFDLEKGTLIRYTVFKLPHDVKKLLVSVSHIIVDGWSMDNILKTFNRYYMQLLRGGSKKEINDIIETLNIESVCEYNNYINSIDFEPSIKYNEDYYKNSENAITTLEHDKDSTVKTYHNIYKFIDEKLTMLIRDFCKKCNITENSLFELAFAYLNHKMDKESRKDILFTKVISGRDINIDNISNMVGTMINIIPQRIKINNDYKEELLSVNKNNLKNMAYDKMDFYQTSINGRCLMKEIGTMIVFCNYYEEEVYGFEYEKDQDQDDIDLSLYIDSFSTKYRLYLTCKKAAYSKKYADNIMKKYMDCVMEIVNECNNNF